MAVWVSIFKLTPALPESDTWAGEGGCGAGLVHGVGDTCTGEGHQSWEPSPWGPVSPWGPSAPAVGAGKPVGPSTCHQKQEEEGVPPPSMRSVYLDFRAGPRTFLQPGSWASQVRT